MGLSWALSWLMDFGPFVPSDLHRLLVIGFHGRWAHYGLSRLMIGVTVVCMISTSDFFFLSMLLTFIMYNEITVNTMCSRLWTSIHPPLNSLCCKLCQSVYSEHSPANFFLYFD